MSSISDAQEAILLASAAAEECRDNLESVIEALERSMYGLNKAAGDTGHPKVEESMHAYQSAVDKLTNARSLVALAQESADEYALGLG